MKARTFCDPSDSSLDVSASLTESSQEVLVAPGGVDLFECGELVLAKLCLEGFEFGRLFWG